MKSTLKQLCRLRLPGAIVIGLGVGWALTDSLGAGSAYAIGGALILALLDRRGSC